MSSCSPAHKDKAFEFRAIHSTFPSKSASPYAERRQCTSAPRRHFFPMNAGNKLPTRRGHVREASGTAHQPYFSPHGYFSSLVGRTGQGRRPGSPPRAKPPLPQAALAHPCASPPRPAWETAAAPGRTCGGAGLLVPGGARSAAAGARRPQERLVLSIPLGPRVLLTLLFLLLEPQLPTQPHSPAGGGFHPWRAPPGRPSLRRRLREEQQPLIGPLSTRLRHGVAAAAAAAGGRAR